MAMLDCGAARSEFRRAIPILRAHGLKQAAKYCAEMLMGLSDEPVSVFMDEGSAMDEQVAEATLAMLEAEATSDSFLMASTFFDLGEYTRCAVALTSKGEGRLPAAAPASSAPSRDVFVWAYALFLAGEKRKEEMILEAKHDVRQRVLAQNNYLEGLRDVLQARRDDGLLVGLLPYMLGVVLKELAAGRQTAGFEDEPPTSEPPTQEEAEAAVSKQPVGVDSAEARSALAESARLFPWNWSAWVDLAELTALVDNNGGSSNGEVARATRRADSDRVASPDIIQACHAACVAIEQQRCEAALKVLGELKRLAPASTFVTAQEALAHYARRDFENAQSCFERLRAADPHRLEHLDIYSNVLYVKEEKAELSRLAFAALRTEKYRPETCCVIGNYYSLKRQHERAVIYFQRALRLDRRCLSAWTLMGHEFIEMKNTAAAIEAYRRAVDVNARDYRAWYGLGQTYEILNMYFYALYYYKKAAKLRPYDARMWIAIAQCHEKLHRFDDAIKFYERAAKYDDSDGHAILKLAKLSRQRDDRDLAAAYYQKYLDNQPPDADVLEPTAEALIYLATRHKIKNNLQEAQSLLARLLDFAGPEKLEAQAMCVVILSCSAHSPQAPRNSTTRRHTAGILDVRVTGPPWLWCMMRTLYV